MITQFTKALAVAILLSTALNAELFNPTSTCNIKQAQIMNSKCNKLDGAKYGKCEETTLRNFYMCEKSKNSYVVIVGKENKLYKVEDILKGAKDGK